MNPEYKKEGKLEIKNLKNMITKTDNLDIAISITIGDSVYWVGNNLLVKKLLKKERKEIKKFIKGKKNKWE